MIKNIQALRAFAAINVVLFHIIGVSEAYGRSSKFIDILAGWGANGVDVFFVISGFVMLHSQMQSKKSVREFIRDRAIRIVPLYWFVISLIIALHIVVPSAFRALDINLWRAALSYAFLSQAIDGVYPIVAVGWTLELEMLFYLIFGIALVLRSWLLVVAAVSVGLLLVSLFFNNFIVLEFLFGMLAAYIYNHDKSLSKSGPLIFLAGSLCLLMSIGHNVLDSHLGRVIVWGAPSTLIVLGLAYSRQNSSRLLAYLGDASYSIYLAQTLTIPAFYKAVATYPDVIDGNVLAVLCLAASVFAGCFLFSFVERPLTIMFKQKSNKGVLVGALGGQS